MTEPIKPIYGVHEHKAQLVIPLSQNPPVEPIDGSVYIDTDENRIYAYREGQWVAGDAAHIGDPDAHPQYLTVTDATTALANKENIGVAAGLIGTHEAAADPHTQYVTHLEGDAAYAIKTHTHPSETTFYWTYDNLSTMADPGIGDVRTDTPAGTPSTQVAIADITENGVDASATLASLTIGDMIFFQQQDNAASWGRFRINAAPTDNGTWWLIPVDQIESQGSPIARNQTVLVRFTYGTGGGGSSGGGVNVDDLSYRHVQDVVASSWVIDHPLQFSPHVTVVVNFGNGLVEVQGDILYPSQQRVVVEFANPVTGEAYLT